MAHNDQSVFVGRPNLGDRELFDSLVDGIFERRWFSNGGVVAQELEFKLCDYLGVKHCILVCNATIGLQLAIEAAEVKGEVIVPAFTFVATPHAVKFQGATPVFADVDPQSHTICPKSVESLITDKTEAILGVHVWGQHCDTNALETIGKKYNLKIMYDAAHAFSCGQHETRIGNFGLCEVFSFHATKFFNTFEGGAITTNDDAFADKLRLMKNFGFAGMDNVVTLGTNAKMSEISAAMGLSVFARLDEIVEHNRRNYQLYKQRLASIAGLRFFSYDHLTYANYQYIVIEIDADQFGVSRDQVFEHLKTKKIFARKYFYPGCHQMEPYRSTSVIAAGQLANSECICNNVLCLPTGTAVEVADVNRVCDEILASVVS